MTRLFRERISLAAEQNKSRVILALDTPASSPDPLKLAKEMISAVHENICAIKINFHLILPLSGSEIADVNRLAHSFGLQSIADIKLNDIENTNDVVVDHLAGRMGFDAVIANPFIGQAALASLVAKARTRGAGVIALVYMSNPGAAEGFGLAVASKKKKLYRIFLERASRADADGVVVGATRPAIIKEIAKENPEIKIYSPGVGSQGGDLERAIRNGSGYLIVGRSIMEAKDPARTAREIKERILKVRLEK
jgi:orotidine-5'-phosphate decarboxylase